MEARGLVKDFGTFRAVDHVSFRIRQGEIFGLLGANGAGKTTVIKMLTGILPPTEGEGRVAGVDMRRAGTAIKARIGYMSQAFSLYLDLTVMENLRLFAGIYGVSSGTRIQEVLAMLQLRGQEGSLSGRLPLGLRQRLALGCAILHRPQVLFLDEPTSGVDPIGRRRFWDILLHLARAEGVAILITTHYMSEAEHCDRLALMHAGRIIAEGPPEGLKEAVEKKAGRLFSLTLDRPMEALPLIERAGFPHAALFGRRIHLLAPHPEADLPRLRALLEQHGITLIEAEPRPLSLEDVFIYHMLQRELPP
ncbi:MAG: ABC transporter ATP-binding protein [Gammaproteobacteria bacterium]|nr:MAG: ABC transporter ATP-binding protein [Gammaproteobacteria bacterium]